MGEVTSYAEVVARRRQRRNVRRLVAAGLALVVCVTGALGVRRSLAARLDAVRRDDSLAAVLSPADERFVNILLVGSDSREGADPNDPDFGNVGGTGDVQGRRSDTLIVMNIERSSGIISLLSIPRDLWVEIGDSGGSDRINTAYRDGSAVVVRTALNLSALYGRVSSPFIPFAAEKIVESFGEAWPPVWPSADAKAELTRLEPGKAVGVPPVLFAKIADEQIAEWTQRFGGADA